MDSINIDLKGSEIAGFDLVDGTLTIRFSRAYLIKTLTGSAEMTRWWQAGTLTIEDADLESALPAGPQICAGGDLQENIYTYRDMIPIPFSSRGHIRCELRLEGEQDALIATGKAARLDMLETPRYIEHLRPER